MKKFILASVIAILGFTVVFTASCNKYEDGPKFSLLSKKARISGEWVVESVTIHDTDATSMYPSGYVLEIDKKGTYTTEGLNPNDSGTWELGEDKDDVRFQSGASGSPEESYRILRLKNKELWLRYTNLDGSYTVIKYKAK